MDLTLHRNETNITIDIYRKPTTTITIIHNNSNHPQEHKEAALRFLLNRLHNLTLTEKQKTKGMGKHSLHSQTKWIRTNTIIKLDTRIRNRTKYTNLNTQVQSNDKKWAVFTFYSPRIRKITNMFRNTNLRISFRTSRSLLDILNTRQHKDNNNIYAHSGIYGMI